MISIDPYHPMPFVGFQFTEENIDEAFEFYRHWLGNVAYLNENVLHVKELKCLGLYQLANKSSLPWTVLHSGFIYCHTGLPSQAKGKKMLIEKEKKIDE